MAEAQKYSNDYTVVTGGSHQESVPSLVSDCRLMLLYARKNGMIVPESLLREISWLDGVLKARSKDSISGIDPALIASVSEDAPIYLSDGHSSAVSQTIVPEAAPIAATTTPPRLAPTLSPALVPPVVDPPLAPASPFGPTLPDPPATSLANATVSQEPPQGAADTATPPDPVPPVVDPLLAPASASDPTLRNPSATSGAGAAASPEATRGAANKIPESDEQPKLDVRTQLPSTGITPAAAAKQKSGLNPEEAILDIHSQLSVLIAPTTALSLQTSEPPPGQYRIFGGMPALVKVVIIIAAVSALCFVVSSGVIATNASKVKQAAAAAASASAASAAAAASAAEAALASKAAVKVGNTISEPIATDANSAKPALAEPPSPAVSGVVAPQPAAASDNLRKQPKDGSKAKS